VKLTFEALISDFDWNDWGNYRKFRSRQPVFQPGSEQDISPVQVRSFVVSSNVFGTSCSYPESHSVIVVFFYCYVSYLSSVKTAVFNIPFCSKDMHCLHVKHILTFLVAIRCVQQFE